MNEYDLAYMYAVHADRVWSSIQFWSSVSFGLLAVSHLASDRLNIFVTFLLTLLYITFSGFVSRTVSLNASIVKEYASDIQRLSAEQNISAGLTQTLATTGSDGFGQTLGAVSIFGLFFGTLIFLWYSLYRVRRENT